MPVPEGQPPEPWWERICGARAISWQSVIGGNALISMAIVATGGTLGGYASGPDAIVHAAAVVLMVTCAATLWAIFGFVVLFRQRRARPVSLWTYFIYYSVNATLYFLGVQWLDVTSGVPSSIGWAARMASSVIIALAWAIAVSLLLDSSDRFRAHRQELLDELVSAEVERLRESQEVVQLREALDDQVDLALASTRARLSGALAMSAQSSTGRETFAASTAADIVRTAASDVVRPLSHRLQEVANSRYPAPRLSGIFRQWWRHPRMPALATALLVSAQTTAESVRNFGGAVGPLASLIYFAALYVFLVMVNRASDRFPQWDRLFYLIGVIVSLGLNLWFAEGLSTEPVNLGDAMANVVLSLAYILITSLFVVTQQARNGLIELLAEEVDAEEVRARALQREMTSIVDALAHELHGRVQTRLVVCAVELERAARAGDHKGIAAALRIAAAALESATHRQQPTLDDVVQAWRNLLSIELSAPGVSAEALGRPDVIAVVEEGLANAYRHGSAQLATVHIESHQESLRVTIIDNGPGFTPAAPGIGTDMMRRLSRGRMTLERLDTRTVLTVDLPSAGTDAAYPGES